MVCWNVNPCKKMEQVDIKTPFRKRKNLSLHCVKRYAKRQKCDARKSRYFSCFVSGFASYNSILRIREKSMFFNELLIANVYYLVIIYPVINITKRLIQNNCIYKKI